MPGENKFVPLGGLAKVEGSNSGTRNLALGLALDVFCAAEGKSHTDFFHNDLK